MAGIAGAAPEEAEGSRNSLSQLDGHNGLGEACRSRHSHFLEAG